MLHPEKTLLCSTGTMVRRANGYNYPRAIRIIKELCNDSIIHGGELMMLTHYYDKFEEVTSAVKHSGVPFPVIHCEKGVGTDLSRAAALDFDGKTEEADKLYNTLLSDFRLNCRFGKEIGAKYMVFHLWSGFDSDCHVEYNISKARELALIAAEHSLTLLFETIPCTTHDPVTNLLSLTKEFPEAEFIYDTRLSALHGQEVSFLREERLAKCIRHIHVSDFIGQIGDFSALRPIYHPTEGQINFESISAELSRIKYSGMITLESPVDTDTDADSDKLRDTFRYLARVF